MSERERTRYYSTRPRRVPPEFCSDERLEECSILAALLLYRVISQADDQGRLAGAARSVRGVCFPMRPGISERKVTATLDELVEAGFLIRFVVDGRTYLQVDRWQDLQGKWGRRAYPSRLPAPPGWTEDWVSVGGDEPDPPEVRARSLPDARDLHPPITVSPSSSFSATRPRVSPGRPGRPDRVADLLKEGQRGAMTDEEAFALGASLVDEVQSSGSVPRVTPRPHSPARRLIAPSRPPGSVR